MKCARTCLSSALSLMLTTLLSGSLASAVPTPAAPPQASPANPLGLRLYEQELTLTFDTPEQATAAKVSLAPVFGGKTWAFSARWDDNHPGNLTMREHLAKLGMRGTFYLNQTDARQRFGAEYARQLLRDGCSIGAHTQTHPYLPGLLPDEIFYEILANRVEREAQTDRPINSLAFGFGRFSSSADPGVLKIVTDAFVRSGLHNCAYFSFARGNPHLKPFEVSAGVQVTPGDHAVEPEKFVNHLEKTLKGAAVWQKDTYLIHLGVHARQQGKVWDDLDTVLAPYAHRPDWWYCSMTEYAAYDRQFRNARIEPVTGTVNATRVYRITRPAAAELGDDVPLTLIVEGATPRNAIAGDATCGLVAQPTRTILNLPHTPGQANPTRIDVVDNPNNAAAPAAGVSLPDFPGLSAWLYCDTAKAELSLTLRNGSGEPLSDLWLTLRLPPRYADGLRRVALPVLAAGQQQVFTAPLGAMRPEQVLQDGRAYFVVEADFRQGSTPSRLFVTARLPQAAATAAASGNVRDGSRMLGPFAETEIADELLLPLSAPAARMEPLGATPNLQWFSSSAAHRERMSSERVTLYWDTREWKSSTTRFDYKPHCFVVALDFELSDAADLTLTSEAKVAKAFLNGAAVDPARITGGVAGRNRLLLKLAINDGRNAFMPFPILMRLRPAAGRLTYSSLPPQ